jgi:hypothetical protein
MELYKIVLSVLLAGLCLVVGLAVGLRKRQELLNRLFFGAFLSYMVFFLFDAMMGILYADSALSNASRDISSLAATTGHTFLFLSGIFIWKGSDAVKNKRFLVPFIAITATIAIIGQFDDWIEVVANQAYVLNHGPIGLFCNYIYGAIIIFICIIIYFKIYAGTENPEVKTRLKRIVTGLVIVVAGQLFQAVLGALIEQTLYYALIFPEALVYTAWAVGILIATRALLK